MDDSNEKICNLFPLLTKSKSLKRETNKCCTRTSTQTDWDIGSGDNWDSPM